MPVICFHCGQPGHKRNECPNVECYRCHQLGHMSRECPNNTRQSASQRRDSVISRNNSSLPPPSSNAHKIPEHWKISEEYTSLSSAVTGLWKEGMKFKMFSTETEERSQIEELMQKTWRENVVGVGADARNLSHSSIQVVKVERVENPELYERYSERKQKLLRRLRDPDQGDRAFSRVEALPGSSGPVLTTKCLTFNSTLRRNIFPKINEHYLFHGTKDEYVLIIARDGMDNRFGNRSSLLGAGLYTAESCTKADQYTDAKTSRTSDLQKMFLVRVLVGQPYVNTTRNPPKFERPPCRNCDKVLCSCLHTSHYDSVLDDSGRLFREFVVYEQCLCYPEYVITYRRVGGGGLDSSSAPPQRVSAPIITVSSTSSHWSTVHKAPLYSGASSSSSTAYRSSPAVSSSSGIAQQTSSSRQTPAEARSSSSTGSSYSSNSYSPRTSAPPPPPPRKPPKDCTIL